MVFLSKSQYMRGLQCPKSLWLFKKRKQFLSPPDAAQQHVFDQGNEVGNLAQSLYPNGKVAYEEGQPFAARFSITLSLLKQQCPAIFEASFKHGNLMCMVDILKFNGQSWDIIEVKSSTQQKEEHIEDLAFQYAVLKACGLEVGSIQLMVLNRDYIRGKSFDVKDYFNIYDLSQEIEAKQEELFTNLNLLSKSASSYQEPHIEIGEHCIKPYTCDAKAYCWQGLEKDSVFQLTHLSWKERFELYQQGYRKLSELPISDPKVQENTITQTLVQSHQKQSSHIDIPALQDFIENIAYPIAYLDFETISSAIPLFEGTKAYQQIPFQFSCHLKNSPFDQASHHEFIADPTKDPRKSFLKALLKALPQHASIMVYNAEFEAKILSQLQDWFPEASESLESMKNRLVDLMIPFKEKVYYDPQFQGRFSIKVTYPSLVNTTAYANLNISDGLSASLSYLACIKSKEGSQKFEGIKADLLAYCEQDTWAMVELFEALQKKSF